MGLGAMQDLTDLYRQSDDESRLAEMHDLVQPTLDELVKTLGYDRAFVALTDADRHTFRGAVGVNVPDGLLDVFQAQVEAQPGPIALAVQLGRPIRVDDVLDDPRVPLDKRGQYFAFGMTSFAVVPLLPASGALVVSKGRPLSDGEINDLLPLAARLTALIAGRLEERRLRESGEQHAIEKEWLWWMLNAVQDPVLLSDDQNNILLCNIHAERLLRTSPQDSPGKRRAIDLNNVLLSAALSRFRLDQGSSLGRELTLVDPIEGHELLFEVICQSATNLRTGEHGLVSILKDVTDLRRENEEVRRTLKKLQEAGEEARRERDRLDLVLENVADPIVVTDPAGEVVLMNPPAERLFRSADVGAGDASAATYLTNMAKLSFFLSQLGLEAPPTRRGELQLVDPSTQELLTMGVTATEIRDQIEQVSAVVSVLHDLTGVRELEQRRVEQKLFESEKLAAIGRLAAAVAHEINNPLEAIKNALYLVVSQTPVTDPNRPFLEIASKETSRVSGIIGQMLGLYRPVVQMVPTNVNDVLEETVNLLRNNFRRHRVVVNMDLQPVLPRVLASPDQLKQVFLNLLLNAYEAIPNGGTVYISTRLSDETDREFLAGRYVLIQIRDTGNGISEEHLPHIFEPFYSTKSESRGTGLGLWVSLGIIQDHDGQIQVRSRPGRGTTFTISLPPEDT